MSPYQSLDSPVSETEFPLLRWEDIQHYLPLSPQSQPSLSDNELAASKISAVLSARTYPYPPPGRSTSRGPRDDLADVPLCCGILLDSSSQEDGHGELSASRDECVEPDQPTRMPSKRQRSDATVAAPSSRKRGRPRKATDRREGIDNNERRRLQVRQAQRAYQSRREANVSSLKSKVSRLEASIERMSLAISSFSNELALSEILDSHSDLAAHWRDIMQTCVAQAKDAGTDCDDHVPGAPQHSNESNAHQLTPPEHSQGPSSPLPAALNESIPPTIDPSPLVKHRQFSRPFIENAALPLASPEKPAFDLSTFIERLHVVCIYHGYLTLSDPSVGLERLQRPFLFLLSMMDREHLTAYVEEALNARISRRPLAQWNEVPFFNLGNAGAHYPQSADTVSIDRPYRSYRKYLTVEDPLSRFSPETQEELSGEWFDMYDLKEYLREKGVHLLAYPPRETDGSTWHAVNTTKLIKSLVDRAICLGRTPAFRRFDVEEALLSALWT